MCDVTVSQETLMGHHTMHGPWDREGRVQSGDSKEGLVTEWVWEFGRAKL